MKLSKLIKNHSEDYRFLAYKEAQTGDRLNFVGNNINGMWTVAFNKGDDPEIPDTIREPMGLSHGYLPVRPPPLSPQTPPQP